MSHRRLVIISLIIGSVLIIGAYIISVYIQPILPSNINSSLITFFLALVGVVTVLGAGISGLNDLLELKKKLSSNSSNKISRPESQTGQHIEGSGNIAVRADREEQVNWNGDILQPGSTKIVLPTQSTSPTQAGATSLDLRKQKAVGEATA